MDTYSLLICLPHKPVLFQRNREACLIDLCILGGSHGSWPTEDKDGYTNDNLSPVGNKDIKTKPNKKNHEVLEQFRTRGWEQLPQIYLRITWSRARRPHSQQLCQRFKRWYLNRGASRFRKDSCTGRQEVKIGYLGWKGKSRIGMKGPADPLKDRKKQDFDQKLQLSAGMKAWKRRCMVWAKEAGVKCQRTLL